FVNPWVETILPGLSPLAIKRWDGVGEIVGRDQQHRNAPSRQVGERLQRLVVERIDDCDSEATVFGGNRQNLAASDELRTDDLRQDRSRWHIARACDLCAEMTRQCLQKGRLRHESKLGEHMVEPLAGRGRSPSGPIKTCGVE